MTSFLKRVIDPDRPFRPSIDLAVATTGHLTSNGTGIGDRASSEIGGVRGTMAIDDGVTNDINDHDDDDDAAEGVGGDVGGRSAGGGGVAGERDVGASKGLMQHNFRHGGGGQHSPLRATAFDEKPRVEVYSSRGMGAREGNVSSGGGGGGGYEQDMDYSRAPPAPPMGSLGWDADSHGGEMMPKVCMCVFFRVFSMRGVL